MAVLTGSLFMDLLMLFMALVAALIAYMKWSFMYWERKKVFAPSPSIPFGNAIRTLTQKSAVGIEIKNVYDALKAKNLRYGGYYFLTKPIFIPVDLELVKNMMTKGFQHFTDRTSYMDEKAEPITAHLFNMKGVKWRNLRIKLTPTFTSGKMKMMFQAMVDCSKDLPAVIGEDMKGKGLINIKDTFARFTTDVIASCAFGLECNSVRDPRADFRQMGRNIFDTNTKWRAFVRLIAMNIPDIFNYLKVRAIREDIAHFFTNIVTQTVNYRERNNVVRKDFLHLLIQLKNNVKIRENEVGELKESNGVGESVEKANMEMDEIVAQVFLFFVAGFETSSTTSTFCLYELAQNQELQDKVRAEIQQVLGKYGGKLTYEAMMEMHYMEKCIHETLRKYPPLPVHTRICTQTYKVPDSDVVIEKGTFAFIPVLGIQRDPDIYPDPDKFDPERFSEENKANRHSSAWTPFGDGPRLCIGLRFGMLQTKVGLTVLLKNYRFKVNPKMEATVTYDPRICLILTARNDILLDAEKIV